MRWKISQRRGAHSILRWPRDTNMPARRSIHIRKDSRQGLHVAEARKVQGAEANRNERLLQLRIQHLLGPPPAPQQYTKSKKRRALAPLVPVGNVAPSPSNVGFPKEQRPSTAKPQTGPRSWTCSYDYAVIVAEDGKLGFL